MKLHAVLCQTAVEESLHCIHFATIHLLAYKKTLLTSELPYSVELVTFNLQWLRDYGK